MALLSDIIVAFHLAYAGFVVVGYVLIPLGAWLKWRWVRRPVYRYTHLAMIGVVALESLIGMLCPLTTLENWLLMSAGQPGYERTFIGRLLYNLLYYDFPLWAFGAAYVTLTILALLLLRWVPLRRVRRDPMEGAITGNWRS